MVEKMLVNLPFNIIVMRYGAARLTSHDHPKQRSEWPALAIGVKIQQCQNTFVLLRTAPGAVGVGGQAQAVEMSSELGVSQTEVGEGHVLLFVYIWRHRNISYRIWQQGYYFL